MKKNAIVRYAICALLAALAVLALVQSKPGGKINVGGNSIAAKLAECGFNFVRKGDYPFCKVYERTLYACRDKNAHLNPERLTFAHDDILALGFAEWLLACAMLAALKQKSGGFATWNAVLTGAARSLAFFILAWAARNAFFGALLAVRDAETIKTLDVPIRLILLAGMLATALCPAMATESEVAS